MSKKPIETPQKSPRLGEIVENPANIQNPATDGSSKLKERQREKK